MTDAAEKNDKTPARSDRVRHVFIMAMRDAETMGAGFVRVNADGSVDLIDPDAVYIKPDLKTVSPK